MFGTLSDLPRFDNFQEAVNYYNKTKGVRGRTHIKPLKTTRRSPDAYRIDAEVDNGGNIRAVQCWLYCTPVLTYTPNEITITCFNSQTTNSFINEIAYSLVRAYTQNGSQVIHVRGEGTFIGNKVVIKVDPKTYQPIKGAVQANKLEEIVLNRTRATEARKSCESVVELARVTSKMDGYWQGLKDSDEVSDDTTLMRLKHLLGYLGYRTYEDYRGMTLHYFSSGKYTMASAEALLPRLKQTVYQNEYVNQDCYDYTPAPYGVIPKNYRSV